MRAFFILLGISLTIFASHAFVADPGFCSNYSTAAVRQVHAARENPACWPGLMGTRWSPDAFITAGASRLRRSGGGRARDEEEVLAVLPGLAGRITPPNSREECCGGAGAGTGSPLASRPGRPTNGGRQKTDRLGRLRNGEGYERS